MEKLTEDQRLKVMKMRDKRLRRKLIQAGYKEVDILGLDRSTLMSFVARVLLAETAYVLVGTEGETEYGDGEGDDDGEEGVAVAVGGEMQAEEINVSLEERRLILEERKLEEQRKQREEQTKQRLLEEKRWQFEQQKWKEELALKKNKQLHRDSMAVKVKTRGDALRNILTKMPSESIEIVSWFVRVEKLFDQLKVNVELQSVLIRPYLSDRAKMLMSKCDPTHSATYHTIKKFLLQELHLSSSVYLDKFNTLPYDKNETFHQFSTRLMSLFDIMLRVEKSIVVTNV